MSEEKEPKPDHDGIAELAVSGYKSIARFHSIEIRPLTILAGANSSGKSSILQALLLLKQTLDASIDPGPLLLEGPNVTFTSADQFLSRLGKEKCCDTFEVGIGLVSGIRIDLSFKRHPGKGFQIHQQGFSEQGRGGTLRPDMTSAELDATFPSVAKEWDEWLAFAGAPHDGDSRAGRQPGNSVTLRVRRNRCFLEVLATYEPLGMDLPPEFSTALIGREISRLIHVPGLRGNPERTYPVAGVGETFPGTFEKYVASVIAKWQAGDKNKLEALNRALDGLGLTYRIVANPVAETRVELMVGRLAHGEHEGENDLVSVADVGFGVSQTLPVLVALLVAEPGQAVYLEEPEIHLHPRAQSAMAGLLAEAAIRGVRVIAETHSSILLRGIQTLVATGKLPPGLVKLHWFTRNPEDGSTEIHSGDLDKQGAFGDWPQDFDEVALETEKQYLDAAETGHRS
jgi:predicted ATPase